MTYNPDRHLGLIVSTWLHSYRQSPYARLTHPATYTQAQRAAIDLILKERGLIPDIVSSIDGTVLAWSLWEGRIAHYIWVAQPLRNSGFASRILREHAANRQTVVSHWSDAAQRAYDHSPKIRQLFAATNSHLPRFAPTLTANPNAFVAM